METRGGTWAAFGRPQGGQATNFGRVGSPKCLLMPPCACSYRLFFESFTRGACARSPWGGCLHPCPCKRPLLWNGEAAVRIGDLVFLERWARYLRPVVISSKFH